MKSASAGTVVPAWAGSCVDVSWLRRWKCDSHLSVSHRGPTGRVPVSCGAGPIFWWRLRVGRGFVQGLLGQRGHRDQRVGLVLLVHLVRFSLKKTHQEKPSECNTCLNICLASAGICILCLWSLWVSAVFTLKRVQGNVLLPGVNLGVCLCSCFLFFFCCKRKQTPYTKCLISILRCCQSL